MYYPSLNEFKTLATPGRMVPVFREILADMETPVSAFQKLAGKQYAFLLESVEGGEKWGRYTFLGADPRMVLTVRGTKVLIRERGRTRSYDHDGQPLAFLKEIIERHTPVQVSGLPRFYGGAVGYFGYDMVRYFERLPAHATGSPVTDDAVFLVTDTLIIFDNVRHTIKVVACAFVNDGDDTESLYHDATRSIDGMARLLMRRKAIAGRREETPRLPSFTANMSRWEYTNIVAQAKEYIAAGDIIQVVLSQRFTGTSPAPALDLYRALRFINPSPYMFFLKLGRLTLIGSSPEVMVRLEEGVVELRPIAGTRRRGGSEQEDRKLACDLLQDPKERAEHVMLVDLGRNDLGRIARTGSVQVTQLMAVERYSHVMHLVSTIRAELAAGKDFTDVIRATFPAGTLSGAPKIRAMEIIDELEPSGRGPYGGAVGYIGYSGNMDLCITIRTMVLERGIIHIQSGAGIVADSDPDSEYEETKSKAQGLIQAVQMAASGL
ncbi:MAG: anthranilate synthase component I [Deltaproteobacteria bacterium]|nr:anthranilate synthase component I [Deltaproteobacteria bacterium]